MPLKFSETNNAFNFQKQIMLLIFQKQIIPLNFQKQIIPLKFSETNNTS